MARSLFGYGSTTKAIAKSGGWQIFDDKFISPSTDEWGNELLPASAFDPQKSSLEITSPGIPPSNALTKQALNLISEYDFYADTKPFKIWISGTNGKTTTAKMTQHLLVQYGSVLGGNVGTPLADLSQNAKIWVLETSSFTIHYSKIAAPELYLLLNITKDHESWHGSFEAYEQAKLKPILSMREGSVAVLPEIYRPFVEKSSTLAYIIYYKDEFDLAKAAGVDIKSINFKPPFLTDALLALLSQKILFDKADVKLLNSFVIEPHKLEELRDSTDRLWVNDTKATNIDASIQALLRYSDKTIHLILGGDDKGVDMRGLFEFIGDKFSKNITIYAIGSNSKKLENLSKEYGLACHKCDVLDAAVMMIDKSLKAGEVALLSPAAASLDQFSSYAERGDKFKALIKSI
ncbi:UDP-N-acetylmuramoyl-L-alanine--D-glutamate ligase [Campylobacter sp. 19-13652]|uniref:UDP-N-acetylmuramoyl-L-alanine--D-glutamate ligase n=1 Tax=Campylobacter sp. 19-13652 TaxID=2840180 RepID=UPI001C793488|nr:UDP-N-acetylmuramoyl-L-alanine--D-glutamate ligase [Campylobacter sp. 19-13652]BCX80047.1 UDP-N-acetylmuramoylalanine--D-glutamate ligase [Campylobacter sp. 19-13652]